MEKIFPTDVLSKRERVIRTMKHQPVDRVVLQEQLNYNSGVISLYTGKQIDGFNYDTRDIGELVRKTVDIVFPLLAPRGTGQTASADGFVYQNDNWTSWHVSRPFNTPEGARDWLIKLTDSMRKNPLDPDEARAEYCEYYNSQLPLIGETLLFYFAGTGFCNAFDSMGLELFVYFFADYPEVFEEYMEVSAEREIQRAYAIGDYELSPVILIAEDFATKQGPIFPPDFLKKYHYPYVKRLAEAWKSHGIHVLYHSDGNYKKAIPDLIECSLDGFYCLEPNVGTDVVELKNTWPEMVWAGGVDGVDLMERGTPNDVRKAVHRQILETNALQTGGLYISTSSEINPPIKPENFKAMVDAVGELRNPDFK